MLWLIVSMHFVWRVMPSIFLRLARTKISRIIWYCIRFTTCNLFCLTLHVNIIILFQNQSTVISGNHSCHYSWIFRYAYKVATIFLTKIWGFWTGNIIAIIHVDLVTIVLMKEICWKGTNVFLLVSFLDMYSLSTDSRSSLLHKSWW